MGRFVFKIPDVGEGTTEVEIVKWHVGVGDAVREEQPLVDLMTDKATVEVASPVSGQIVSRRGAEGDKANVGSELVVFEIAGGETASPPRAPAAEAAEPRVEAVEASAEPATHAIAGAASGKVLAAPAVRTRAAALGVDLSTVRGTGPGGRVLHADLDARLGGAKAAAAAPEGVEEVRIIGLRRRIAQRMQESKRRIPHFAYVEEVDVTELEALRRELNAGSEARAHLTPLAFVVAAVAQSLAEHPAVNAQFDDERDVVRRFRAVHAGIATQSDDGLMVPVVFNAETLDLWRLAAEIARLAAAARAGRATARELTGSTITITSLGALGGLASTPIINPPEVAIVGVGRIAPRPAARDGAVAIREMMNLSSSFDHRIVDGYAAATFIKAVRARLEAPASLIAGPT
jgi:2-oxoisovalerate dehydrogenase E2 component (dihydrolipoyl transacylase)